MLASVVIPALNEANNIQQAITAARCDYTPEEVEIIVVDGGSSDGTPDMVPPGVTLIRSPADSQLPVGWREAVVGALSDSGVSGGTFQTLALPERGVILYIRNRLSFPANWKIMFGDQAQFMSRATFERVGGFQEIPLMEDVEMSRVLHREGNLVRIPARVITSSRRSLERGPLRQWLLNIWAMFRYLYLGATPEQIAQGYRSSREVRT
jgi:GT2 family glycosyltransferase